MSTLSMDTENSRLKAGSVAAYHCNICDRPYGSRSALKRHENSHNLHTKHPCHFCKLQFHRQDLLVRHLRIHKASESVCHSTGRQRSAIACDFCRKAKRKCNGGIPCRCCRRIGETCTYSQPVARLSLRSSRAAIFDDNEGTPPPIIASSPQNSVRDDSTECSDFLEPFSEGSLITSDPPNDIAVAILSSTESGKRASVSRCTRPPRLESDNDTSIGL